MKVEHRQNDWLAWPRARRTHMLRVAVLSLALLFTGLGVYAAPGDLDPTFDGDGKVATALGTGNATAWGLVIQPDGKLVVGGVADNGANGADFALARYNGDGSLDPTFNSTGKLLTTLSAGDNLISALALQNDGKIIASGVVSNPISLADVAVVRYNSDGTLDSTFDSDGIVATDVNNNTDITRDVVIQNDGKIIVAGYTINALTGNDFLVARYNVSGTLDSTFAGDGIVTTDFNGGNDTAYVVELQSDGKIVVVGEATNGANGLDVAIARYNSDGSLDTSFDGDGKVITAFGPGADRFPVIAVQRDGKLVVAGGTDNGGNTDFALARYNSDGTLDTSFDGDGKVTTPLGAGEDQIYDMLIQPDDKIVVIGWSHNGANLDGAVARYTPNGALDASFSGDGILTIDFNGNNDLFKIIARQPDSKLVVAGDAINGATSEFAVARLLNDSTPPTTTLTLNPAAPNGGSGLYLPPVHVSISAVDFESIVAETRCVLDPVTPPASFASIPVGCAYTGLGGDVTAPGPHTVYAASRDSAGNLEAPHSVSFTIAQPTLTVTPTPTNTDTPTITPTGTVPTATLTATATTTPTLSPTPIPTATPTAQPTHANPQLFITTNGAAGVRATRQRTVAANASGIMPPSADDRSPDYREGFEQGAAGLTVTNEATDGSTQVWSVSGAQAQRGVRSLGLAASQEVAAATTNAGALHTWLSNVQAFDLRTAQQADIEFFFNLDIAPTASFFVGVSTDNQTFDGVSWSGDSGGWQRVDLDLREFLGQPQVYVAWVFQGSLNGAEGVWVDDLAFWSYQTTSPASVTDPVINGDFETGDVGNWELVGGAVVEVNNPVTGRYAVQMGGRPNAADTFTQRLVLPADTGARASFDFWLNLFGAETKPDADLFCVALYGELNGQIDLNNRLVDLGCLDGITAYTLLFDQDSWEQVNYTLTRGQWNAVRGQTVYAHFTMQTDADLDSTVYLDDVQINVRSGGSPGDVHEPNDAPAEATPIPLDTPVDNLTIDPDEDLDHYPVRANAGDTLVVNIDASINGSPLDAVVKVYDSAQKLVCQDDDDAYSLDPYLTCPITTADTYDVVVSAYDDNGDRSKEYAITIKVIPPNVPTPANPTPIPTPTSPPPPTDTWTVMLYMDGDTNLCGAYPVLIERIEQELGAKIGPNGFLNVLVLLDRLPSFCTGDGSTTRYHVQVDGKYTDGRNRWPMGELNMGDPQTLVDFVTWAMRNYPADRYYLALDDHGAGVSGLAWDDSNLDVDQKTDKLTNLELYSAFKQITRNGAQKLDVLAYEACLMGLLENAYDVRRFTDYLFFFPTINYTNNASYPSYLKDARFQASTTGRQLGDIMFDVYYQAVTRKAYAMSLVETQQIPAVFSAFNAWATALTNALPAGQAQLTLARTLAQKVDSNQDGAITEEDQYVDLWDLADKVAAQGLAVTEGAALKAAIEAAVVRSANRSSGPLLYDRTHGLTIYWPQTASGWYRAYVNDAVYSATRDGQWDDFLRVYFGERSRPGLTPDAGAVDRQANDISLFLPLVVK
ncbi:MAG: clostripain-related cysteine peptidase [Caldilineaceae bacterium]